MVEIRKNPPPDAVRQAAQHVLSKRSSFVACSHPDALAERLLALIDEWTGGRETLEFGHGTWLARLRGKEVFPTVAARGFKLVSTEKRTLQGPQMQRELAKSLLRRPLAEQPQDLQDLRRLIETRVRA